MPVHQVGLPADMDAVRRARRRATGSTLVEDAACAIGATLQRAGRSARSGPLACFSLPSAQGDHHRRGRHDRRRTTRRSPTRLRRLRQHAMDVLGPRAPRRDATSSSRRYPERGCNYRMTDIQAALGLRQLEALDDDPGRAPAPGRALQRRARARSRTSRRPYEPDYARAHLAVLPRARRRRTRRSGATELMRRAAARRHRHAPRRDGDPPRAGLRRAAARRRCRTPRRPPRDVVMLPLFPGLTDEQQDYVIERLAAHVVALAA